MTPCKICGSDRVLREGLCTACWVANYRPPEPPTPHIPRLSIAAAMLAGDDSVATVVLTQEEVIALLRTLTRVHDADKLYNALRDLHTNARAVIVFKGSWDDT